MMAQVNTLFKYFTKSPKAVDGKEGPVSTPNGREVGKRKPESLEKESSVKKRSRGDVSEASTRSKHKQKINATPKSQKAVGKRNSNRENQTLRKSLKFSSAETSVDSKNSSIIDESDEEDNTEKDELRTNGGKRHRIQVLSSDEGSDEEFKPDPKEKSSASEGTGDEDEIKTKSKKGKTTRQNAKPAKKRPNRSTGTPKAGKSPSQSRSPSVNETSVNRLSAFAASNADTPATVDSSAGDRVWPHLNFEFLKPGKRKDANRNLESHPDFNPKTLHVPDSFKQTLTPALKQWWEMKMKHFDVVLFFKLGKFYELYHMDAVICFKELDLLPMKGELAHCGFPEKSYGNYSQRLIQQGYRVARIEQTETPAMMEERCKKLISKPSKFDKVVKREICQISSQGTRRFSALDGLVGDHNNKYLLAVTEKFSRGQCGSESEYGVCFVDTTIGKFHIGQFKDDRHGSHFRTLLAHHTPVEVLYEKGALSSTTHQIMKSCLHNVIFAGLAPKTEFWGATKTLKHLAENKYFVDESKADGVVKWPDEIKKCLDENDSLGTSVKSEHSLAIQALGACLWYLVDSRLDQELISMKNFVRYKPVDVFNADRSREDSTLEVQKYMVLDGITLSNLDVVENSSLNTTDGTLFGALDYCKSPFGKRLLKQWICVPLCNPATINERLDAVAELLENNSILEEASDMMKKLPDLERFLSKIHAEGSSLRSKTHPDSRAIFFEEVLYSKRKINDFLLALKGYETAVEITELFGKADKPFESKLVNMCVNTPECGGRFPRLNKMLKYFDNAFDHETAKLEGKIIPARGVNSDYDNAVEEKEKLRRKLDNYLKEQCKHFGCKVVYFGSDKNRYQIEVPASASKLAGDEYELHSERKGFKRFWTKATKKYIADMILAEDKEDAVLRDIMRQIFETFANDFVKWNTAVECLAVLDVLMAFTRYAQNAGSPICRPEILLPTNNTTPFIEINDGRYPCTTNMINGDQYIPNDTVIGVNGENGPADDAKLVIVTGPNMGGKSTLMRQVGIIVIMAQLGCYVPAEKCRLTPVDRLFTRLGARDRIMSGESTFFVELSETTSILQHVTKHSLVLMDELGRGTSTYDGTAIAYAVVKELAENVGCRTLFSTHYYSIVEDFQESFKVKLGHMACMVDNDKDNDEDEPSLENITFLYKFIPGACPKSYGFNAARLAGIMDEIIKEGSIKAKEMEKAVTKIKMFRELCAEIKAN